MTTTINKKKLALCIGDNYPGTSFSLSNCVNDAVAMAAALAAAGFTVTKLLDSQATFKGIKSAFERIIATAKSGDTVFIYNSGHGTYVPDGPEKDEPDGCDEALCPYDIEDNGPFIDDMIYSILKERQRAVKTIMASDSCYSGTLIRGHNFGCTEPNRAKTRFLPPSVFMSREKLQGVSETRANFTRGFTQKLFFGGGSADDPSPDVVAPEEETEEARIINPCLFISGCSSKEYSYDAPFSGAKNGAMTYYFLSCLKELQKTGKPFTYRMLHAKMRNHLPSQAAPQSPQLEGVNKDWAVF